MIYYLFDIFFLHQSTKVYAYKAILPSLLCLDEVLHCYVVS